MTNLASMLVCLAIVLSSTSSIPTRSINEVNVLLPFSRETKVEYELTTSGGCYTWRSTLPQVISVSGGSEECSESAKLRVETVEPDDRVVWIMATDKSTGAEVRVEARVEQLVRIEILTKLRTIEVGDLATLELIGFDIQGNAFSTLEGLRFEWTLSSQGGQAEIISFIEAGLSVSGTRAALEAAGRRSDQLVLRGVRVGPLRIAAGVAEPLVSAVKHEVPLLVVENFILWPEEDLLLPPCDSLQLKLSVFRREGGSTTVVPVGLPGKRFEFLVDGPQVDGRLTATPSGLLQTTAAGEFSVKLVVDGRAETTLEKKVRVAPVKGLKIEAEELGPDGDIKAAIRADSKRRTPIGDGRGELLLDVGKRYVLRAFALDSQGHELRLGGGRSVTWSLPENQLMILSQSGQSVVVEAAGLGIGSTLGARLASDHCGGGELSATRGYSIVSAVRIVAPTDAEGSLALPAVEGGAQLLRLAALGGSGEYEWSSSNSTAVGVSALGVLKANAVGEARVTLADSRNRRNSASIRVIVLPVVGGFVYDLHKELGVGGGSRLWVGAVGFGGQKFANCSAIDITPGGWRSGAARVESLAYSKLLSDAAALAAARPSLLVATEAPGLNSKNFEGYLKRNEVSAEKLDQWIKQYRTLGLCRAVWLSADQVGEGQISLAVEGAAGAAISTRAFEASTLELPRGFDTTVFGEWPVVSSGSSVSFVWSGGPKAWFEGAELKRWVVFANPAQESDVEVTFGGLGGDRELVTIRCLRASSSPIILSINAAVGQPSHVNSTFTASNEARVFCHEPNELRMFAPSIDSRSSNFTFLKGSAPSRVALRADAEHDLIVWAFDPTGTALWNFTQPILRWDVQPSELGRLNPSPLASAGGLGVVNARGKGKLHLAALTGDLRVEASTPTGTKASLVVASVRKLALEPANAVLRLGGGRKQWLKVINGSGRFRVSVSDPSVAKVDASVSSGGVEVTPLRRGRVTVRVEDLELAGDGIAEASIEFVEPDRLEVEVMPHAFDDSTRTLKVRVFGGAHLIDPSQLDPADFKFSSSPEGLEVISSTPETIEVRASNSGEFASNLHYGDSPAASESITLNFYEKLGVFPENVVVFPGCSAVLRAVGGPPAELRRSLALSLKLDGGSSNIKIEPLTEDSFRIWAGSDFTGSLSLQLRNSTSVFRAASVGVIIAAIDGLNFRHPQSLAAGHFTPLEVTPTIRGREVSPAWCPFAVNITSNDPSIAFATALRPSTASLAAPSAQFNVTGLRAGQASFSFEFLPLVSPHADRLDTRPLPAAGPAVRGSTKISIFAALPYPLGGFPAPCVQVSMVLPPESRAQLPEDVTQAQIVHSDFVANLVDGKAVISQQKLGIDVLLVRKRGEDPSNLQALPIYVSTPMMMYIPELSRGSLMPPETSLTTPVIFLDKFGRQFFAPLAALDIVAFSSDPSVLDVSYSAEIGKLSLRARRAGSALLILRAKNFPGVSHVLGIFVGPPILPASELVLVVGASVAFKPSPLTGLDQNGDWSSSAPEVLKVENDGSAVSKSPGLAKVTLINSYGPSANVEVVIPDSLRPLHSNPRIVTSVADSQFFQEVYEFNFELLHRGKPLKLSQNRLIKQNLIFLCESNSEDIRVRAKPITLDQPFSCDVSLRKGQNSGSPKESFSILLKSENSDFELTQNVEVDIVASFFVNGGINSIYTNLDKPDSSITVKTQDQLDISAGDLTPFVKTFFHPSNRTQFITFSIPKGYKKSIKSSITLLNKSSHQSLNLPFIYEPDSGFFSKFSLNFASGSHVGATDLLVIGICLTIIYYIFGEYRNYK